MRQIQKFKPRNIPHSIAQAIGIIAPKDELAGLVPARCDDVANSIVVTVYDRGHADKMMGLTCLAYKDGNRIIVIPYEAERVKKLRARGHPHRPARRYWNDISVASLRASENRQST